jgi:hypothetical protein
LEIRAEQLLPGSKEELGEEREVGGEMAQAMYVHMNKQIKKIKEF